MCLRGTTGAARVGAGLVVLALAVAGCDLVRGGKDSGDKGSASSPSASASASPSPGATAAAAMPSSCARLLPASEVDRRVGYALPGTVSYLREAPLPAAHRLGRVTCGYGVPPRAAGAAAPQPLVEVSYLLYADPGTASGRVDATVSRARTRRDTVTSVTVAGAPAYLLTSKTGTTLVMVKGNATCVVSLAPAAVPRPKAAQVATGLAGAVWATVAARS